MKIYSALFFLLITQVAAAQWQDDFSDGNFSHMPEWTGDTMNFTVNADLQLQLDAVSAGSSMLVTQSTPDMHTNLEWRFTIRQNFSPSGSNYSRVYLVSDQPDLRGPLNGYYLRFGEVLSNDAVELFRQDGLLSVSVCKANAGAIANPFAIGVRVTRDVFGMWKLMVDYGGGTNYLPESYGMEAMYTTSVWFGVYCEYTAGNVSNFFFDDFYVGPMLYDTIPPELLSLSIIDSSSLTLQFSEVLDSSSTADIYNYTVDAGIGNPVSAQLMNGDPSRVILNFASSFVPAFLHTIQVNGVRDLSGNTISPYGRLNFTYYPLAQTKRNDVIFTEVMFEPTSSSSLPNFEYVELFNRSDKAISLFNWSFSDASTVAGLPQYILLPGQYVIVCAMNAVPVFTAYGDCIGVASFPVLNNDVGDHIKLYNENEELIDEFVFSDKTYRDIYKDNGGYSLERIDTSFLCQDPLNWKASVSAIGGTPGNMNSVSGIYRDHTPPQLLSAVILDSLHLLIEFSEVMDAENIPDRYQYSISSEHISSFHPDSVIERSAAREYLLRLPYTIDENIYTLNLSGNLKDCSGNYIDPAISLRFAKAVPMAVDDVVINEILFNPTSGGSDFVELYNRSQKVLDLKGCRIAKAPYEAYHEAQTSVLISAKNRLLFPGEFIALSRDIDDIMRRYDHHGIRTFLNVDGFPDFNSGDGAVILYDSLGQTIDQFSYSEKMHFPLLIEKKGVSLERLSADKDSRDENNWNSASTSSGFATPGYKNSRGWNSSVTGTKLHIEPEIFSPDNDGINDLLYIRLSWDGEQGIASVFIFDLSGRMIRQLTKASLTGEELALIWNGLDDRGEIVPEGIYIVFTELFTGNGTVEKSKAACALSLRTF